MRAGHLGTPCNSFSRARDHPPGPPPLRSNDRPLGLPELRPHDRLKVKIGNALMRFSVRLMNLALLLIIPFTLENPRTSRLWLCPGVRHLLRRKHCSTAVTEFCQFGTAWRKSTQFAAVHLNIEVLELYRCLGSRRGLCKRTGLPHTPLCGTAANGQWLTKIAEPYPCKLCTVLALCFMNFETAQLAEQFWGRLHQKAS